MKIILKIVGWILGLFLCILSIAGFSLGDFWFSFLILLIGIFLLPPVNKLLFFNRRKINTLFNKIDFKNADTILESTTKALSISEKPLTSNILNKLGRKVYFKSLSIFLNDLILTSNEKELLVKLKAIYRLSASDIYQIHNSINKETIQRFLENRYAKKLLTDEDKAELKDLGIFLNLDPKEIEKIRQNLVSSIFKLQLKNVIADRLLSPSEESMMKKLLVQLEIGNDISSVHMEAKDFRQLIFYKALWQTENGYMLPLTNHNLALQKDEECYMAFPVLLFEQQNISAGYKSINNSLSIPVRNGVRYKIGTSYSLPMIETVTNQYPGTIYLTDRRIIFSGGNKSFKIKFDNLISYTPFSNGINLIIEGYVYQLKFTPLPKNTFFISHSVELFCSALSSCLRYFQNPNDPVYQKALKEVKENEQLIEFAYE